MKRETKYEPLQYSNEGLLCVWCVVLWHSITPSFSSQVCAFCILYIVYCVLIQIPNFFVQLLLVYAGTDNWGPRLTHGATGFRLAKNTGRHSPMPNASTADTWRGTAYSNGTRGPKPLRSNGVCKRVSTRPPISTTASQGGDGRCGVGGPPQLPRWRSMNVCSKLEMSSELATPGGASTCGLSPPALPTSIVTRSSAQNGFTTIVPRLACLPTGGLLYLNLSTSTGKWGKRGRGTGGVRQHAPWQRGARALHHSPRTEEGG